MEFRKYTSIENTYNEEFIQLLIEENLSNEVFIVQEKAHGGNLSLWTSNGETFKTAKRTAFLEPTENFYNHQAVLKSIQPKLVEIWNLLSEKHQIEQMTFFGEIIGGIYPHPEVIKDKTAFQVQKGVYYSPSNVFYAFDILINNNHFLSTEDSNKLFEHVGILYAKTLFQGSLKEVLNYPNTFQTTISTSLNLPEIARNTCEGIVIKTLHNITFKNGKRIILKNKNEKWAEREKNIKPRKKVAVGDEVKVLIEDIKNYVTENRLNNVLSKIGEVTQKDFGSIMGLFSKDVIEDFKKDFKAELSKIEDKDFKLISKSITEKMTQILRERLD